MKEWEWCYYLLGSLLSDLIFCFVIALGCEDEDGQVGTGEHGSIEK